MNTKKLVSILVVTVIVIIIAIVSFSVFNQKQNLDNNNGSVPTLTTSYTNITVQDAYNIIYNENRNITIIDLPTTGITRYNDSHLENAIMIDDQNYLPEGLETLYGTKNDILVYDDDGRGIGISYCCEKLVNHTYGKIYYLIGGFSEWKLQGYPWIPSQ